MVQVTLRKFKAAVGAWCLGIGVDNLEFLDVLSTTIDINQILNTVRSLSNLQLTCTMFNICILWDIHYSDYIMVGFHG